MKIIVPLLISLVILSLAEAKQDSDTITIIKNCQDKMDPPKSACTSDADCKQAQLEFNTCASQQCTSLDSVSDQVSCAKKCYPSNSILKKQTDFMIDCLSSPIIIIVSSLISFLFLF
ncbi:transmembrane protein, putative (macronuclear) [Tetrahymena thermophila SB210]|uniref:Transmembrane protein, putative n=1 Tax=Tetrahymena thermophila (strain SB210) TaxID=312017 RepID=Q24FI1_TETTS|nr:transmembrane protein, putative [Tetrahymena thermophila SB210]EAS06477.1 transmembrane protein, putative [Tetrahymena thermophila SB210]|eukprot:XP_001026722.1 transmembrane protein, putative [Tetrahymena thermophila SB210]